MISFIFRALCIYFFTARLLFSVTEDLFASLSHEDGHPQRYSLVCLDSRMIPKVVQPTKLEKRTDLDGVKKWLKSDLIHKIESEHKSFELLVTQNTFKETKYNVIQLHTYRSLSSSERLLEKLSRKVTTVADKKIFTAGMLVFNIDQDEHQALAYVFGRWDQLCNPYAVIQDWGLRLATSKEIFSGKSIKSIWGRNNFDPNPSTRKERKHFLATLESFALEVGTEGLFSLKLLPKYSITSSKCKRLVEGSDSFKFYLPPAPKEKLGSTMGSLFKMSCYLLKISQQDDSIHPKFLPYIDMKETNQTIISELEKKLVKILTSKSAKDTVFLSKEIWKLYDTGAIFPIDTDADNKDFFKAVKNITTLDCSIHVRKNRSSYINEETVRRFIFTSPIQWNKTFYRFDRGQWFKVDDSRFDKIVSLLRSPEVKLSSSDLGLLDYTTDDAKKSEQKSGTAKSVDYKEANYNKRVIESLDSKGILLDRINVSLGGNGNIFEFGDIFICKDPKKYYIVHVKRRNSGDIDHHRAQVERCAEYLATHLSKDSAKGLLLQGCVNGLYLKYKVSINKVKNQKERLTHGTYFLDQGKPKAKETFKAFCKKLFRVTEAERETNLGKLKIALSERISDFTFFKNHLDEFHVVLDTLNDCATKTEVAEKDIDDFICGMRQFTSLQKLLFSPSIKKNIRKKINIVMAVIDDRKVDKTLKAQKLLDKVKASKTKIVKEGKKEITLEDAEQKLKKATEDSRKAETRLFLKQNLWGLDRTRQLVQRHGFKFNLVIINETPKEGWDAFGPIESIKKDVDTSYEDSDESTESKIHLSDEGDVKPSGAAASHWSITDEVEKEIEQTLSFGQGKLSSDENLNLNVSQKLGYDAPDPDHGIYAEYLTCPTIGDGDCFFHAALTEEEETESEVCAKAAALRINLCDAIKAGEHIEDCRHLLYEHFRQLYTELSGAVPKKVRDMFEANDKYEEVKGYLVTRGIPIPAELTVPHTEEEIKAVFEEEEIKSFMENLRVKGLDSKTYIPVRKDMKCPAQILAEQTNKKIHIFTFDKDSYKLKLFKTIGSEKDDAEKVSILLEGAHYVRLYNPNESDEAKKAAKQIILNAHYL